MNKSDKSSAPTLQQPGMGLPKSELFVARILVGFKMRLTSQQRAAEIFADEAKKIEALVGGFKPEHAAQRVLIDRLRGLEDSSRNWSLYMTVEHLRIVNQATLGVINKLRRGERPQVVVSTAAVKPRDGVGPEVMAQFKALCTEFSDTFKPDTDLDSKVTLPHPWFGELNARQWHFFAGFHMALHRKQILKIAEQLQC